jgi:hypothetical protein
MTKPYLIPDPISTGHLPPDKSLDRIVMLDMLSKSGLESFAGSPNPARSWSYVMSKYNNLPKVKT